MRVVAVKRPPGGRRDRFVCHRGDGVEVSWAVAGPPGLPHDLQHLAVESVLGLERGFWGLVAAGLEPAHRHAVRTLGGSGRGLHDLLVAEAAAVTLVEPHPRRQARFDERCRALGIAPVPVADRLDALDACLGGLRGLWAATGPGRGLELRWPWPGA